MIEESLSRRRSETLSGRGCGWYEWRGASFRACDDALCAIEVQELLSDPGDDPMPALLGLMFPGELLDELIAAVPAEATAADIGDLASRIAWDAFGVDLTGERAASWEEPAFDFAEDAARIRTSLLSAYGLDWGECRTRLSYAELCGLLSGLMESGEPTPFSQAIRYRTSKPPKATKYNKEEREAFEALRRHFSLKGGGSPEERAAAANARAADDFAAELRAAGGGARG